MKDEEGKNDTSDMENIKDFLMNLGFISNSDPSAQHLIYTKNGETIIIKNSKS